MKPVWIEGEGVIAEDGSFYTEERVRRVIERINALCEWYRALPAETRDFIEWQIELNEESA